MCFVVINDWYISVWVFGYNEISGNLNGLCDIQIVMQEVELQKVWMGDLEWIVGMMLYQDQFDQVNFVLQIVEVDDVSCQFVEGFVQVNVSWQFF